MVWVKVRVTVRVGGQSDNCSPRRLGLEVGLALVLGWGPFFSGAIVFCKIRLLKLLSKILKKYLRKSSFLVKLQVLKMKSFTRIFQGFC